MGASPSTSVITRAEAAALARAPEAPPASADEMWQQLGMWQRFKCSRLIAEFNSTVRHQKGKGKFRTTLDANNIAPYNPTYETFVKSVAESGFDVVSDEYECEDSSDGRYESRYRHVVFKGDEEATHDN